MKTQNTRIIVIEKDELSTTAYKSYFEPYNEFVLVKTYTNLIKALKELKTTKPDIVICEVALESGNGIDAIGMFKKKVHNVQIIMISSNNDFEIIKKAFKEGANGYLTKPMSSEKLHYALVSLQREGAAMSNDIVKKVIANFHKKSFNFFSERENQIVDYLFKGATYKMIADKLFVSTSTVNFHIQNIYLKLDVNSKSEALTKLERM